MSEAQKSKIEIADNNYVHAVFEALMNFQAIEALLKECILKSYEIIAASCPGDTTFTPSEKNIKDIKNRIGLGGLAEKFKEITLHKELCKRIQSATGKRNSLAHKAAAEYLKFPISLSGAIECQSEADNIQLTTEEANNLYYELIDIYNQIEEEHGKAV